MAPCWNPCWVAVAAVALCASYVPSPMAGVSAPPCWISVRGGCSCSCACRHAHQMCGVYAQQLCTTRGGACRCWQARASGQAMRCWGRSCRSWVQAWGSCRGRRSRRCCGRLWCWGSSPRPHGWRRMRPLAGPRCKVCVCLCLAPEIANAFFLRMPCWRCFAPNKWLSSIADVCVCDRNASTGGQVCLDLCAREGLVWAWATLVCA